MFSDKGIEALEATIKIASDFLSEIVYPTIGKPLKELGEISGDSLRYFRFKNQVNILIKAQATLKAKGIAHGHIPSKLLVPLLENGSLEDEESMLEKWANLLANALDPNSAKETREAYIEILKQLLPKEVLILDKFFDYYSVEFLKKDNDPKESISMKGETLREISGLEQNKFEKCMDNIIRLDLVGTTGLKFGPSQPGQTRYVGEAQIVFSAFGYDFVSICRGK